MSFDFDVGVIGGGILGLSAARELGRRFPGLGIVVIEKEKELARHQTGHNSGVIHSGIYYKPGSLKARNCVTGARMLTEFCDDHGILYEKCGKVIVAVDDSEVPALEELYRRGVANGVAGLRRIGPEELRELEPYARGVAALHSPDTGIVDYTQVAKAYASDFEESGGQVYLGTALVSIKPLPDGMELITSGGSLRGKHLINCAGLYADVVSEMMSPDRDVRIIPFRGDYYTLSPRAEGLVRGLIYPVPDPSFPFLGVHFTKTVRGYTEAGPNAVLAFAREGYTIGKVNGGELLRILSFPGFWLLTRRYWRMGMQEFFRSVSKQAFLKAARRLVPEIQKDDLVERGAGVRAQAVDRKGRLLDDFLISSSNNAVHVRNAPSPGATASIAIGRHVVDAAEKAFGLNVG